MSTSTPEFMLDLAARIVTLKGATFPAASIVVDKEEREGAGVAVESTWLRFVSQERDDYDKDGAVRHMTVQVKHRFDLSKDPLGIAARVRCVALYDAMHLSSAFTGSVSGAAYIDLVCRTFPRRFEDNYVIWDVVVEFDTPST